MTNKQIDQMRQYAINAESAAATMFGNLNQLFDEMEQANGQQGSLESTEQSN